MLGEELALSLAKKQVLLNPCLFLSHRIVGLQIWHGIREHIHFTAES